MGEKIVQDDIVLAFADDCRRVHLRRGTREVRISLGWDNDGSGHLCIGCWDNGVIQQYDSHISQERLFELTREFLRIEGPMRIAAVTSENSWMLARDDWPDWRWWS